MKLLFYPYDYQYKVKDDKVYVYLYSKLKDGQKCCIRIEYNPYFYAKSENVPFLDERLKEIKVKMGHHDGRITAWEEVQKELLGRQEKLLKIYTNIPKAVPPISQELESWGIQCYEKDILFIQRFVRDTGILPLTLTEAEGEYLSITTTTTITTTTKTTTTTTNDDNSNNSNNNNISNNISNSNNNNNNNSNNISNSNNNNNNISNNISNSNNNNNNNSNNISNNSNNNISNNNNNNSELRVPLFTAKTMTPISQEKLQQLRILSVDIETYAQKKGVNPSKNPILMIAFSGIDELGNIFRKVLTWKHFPHQLEYLEVVADERELLLRFKEIILHYQPDIMTGYFTDGFDFPYLKTRADLLKVTLDLGMDYSELEAGDQRKDSKINGILHLDVFKFVRNIFGKNLKTDSFSLDEVAYELLGHRKHKVDISKLYSAWDNTEAQLEEYCKYNLHDADLTLNLCLKLLPEMIEFSHICGLPLFDVIRMTFSRLVESYIQKKAIDANVLSPNRPSDSQTSQRMDESYEGAFVYEPHPGLYHSLIVFDFRSLYPSIITSHNLGPESLNCSCCKQEKESHVPGLEEYWFCKKRKFIPQLLEELIVKRGRLKIEIKEMKKASQDTSFLEAKSYALKILANSFYGYLGYFGARWYCFECARSTTAYARDYIQETMKKAEEQGFKVVYGDTDSLFVQLGNKTVQQAKDFLVQVNEHLPGQMELEFEGFYTKGLFVGLKGRDNLKGRDKDQDKKSGNVVGAKKKYALLREDGTLKITGFETIRRNWSEISKEMQENVLHLVLEEKNEEAVKYARSLVADLKTGKIPREKLIIKTKITRELESYSSISPHVKVAQDMVNRGDPVAPGMIVEYIIVKGSDLVRDRAKIVEDVKEGEYDADYYLNNQLIPAVAPIFAVIGYSQDAVFSDTKQKGLSDFFE